ncbi:MAG: diacylglycerol kinase family lipid kinase [Clostridiales bacterium]|nr:diacylglycerol kinase family lipid kinase [Clostridiales bacterium]
MDFCLICNPIAGRGAALAALELTKERLEKEGRSFVVKMSDYPGHAVELAREASGEGHGCIVALGGDGTVREVALPLAHSDAVLALVPCGTGNDFARALAIPSKPEAALEILTGGRDQRIDTGLANETAFINVSGFGFDVDVLDAAEMYKKKGLGGKLAYWRGILHSLGHLKLRRTEINADGQALTRNVMIMAAGNGTHFGGGMRITPQAEPADGLLDVCIVHDISKLRVLSMLPRLQKGTHITSKYVTYLKAREITAVCEPCSRAQVDGEVIEQTPVVFRVAPQSLTVRVAK